MKINKKTAMVTSFAVGLVLFTTTVMAEVASKSPYEQVKDSVKYSAQAFESKLSNYTVDLSMVIKDNGKIIESENTLSKCDNVKKSQQNIDTSIRDGKKAKSIFYRDKNVMITHDSKADVYHEIKFETPDQGYNFHNPFKEKNASDIEKIGDALVGNLKDYVVVSEKSDGSKELSGSISESQIPTIINAITSYMVKSNTSYNTDGTRPNNYMPTMIKDIYVKEIKAQMLVDKNGLIKNALGSGTFYGKDDKGKEHVLTFELLIKVSNVNSTAVNKPNLTGKKVEKSVENNRRNPNNKINPKKYIGKYKTDILIDKDNKFTKIGEGILNITEINDEFIRGSYEEKYLKGYEGYKGKLTNFKFNAKINDGVNNGANFNIEGVQGNCHIFIDAGYPSVYFNLPHMPSRNIVTNGNFNKVFE